jgi:site-specific DNA recombinase
MQSYFAALDVTVHAEDKDFDGERGMIAYNKTDQQKEAGVDSTALEPKYVSTVERKDIDEWIISIGKHKGLISGADWIKTQTILADISANQSARPKESSKALLSDVVRCVVCGSPMSVRAESNRYTPEGALKFHYFCKTKRHKNASVICEDSPNVQGNEIDAFVVEQIINMSMGESENSFDDELLNSKKTLSVKSKETEKEINTLKRRLAQIKSDISSLTTDLIGASDSVKQAIFTAIESLSDDRNAKQDRLDALCEDTQEQVHQLAEIEKAKQTIKDFPRLMALVDYEGKLQLLRQILECVIVKDGYAHIFLKGTETPPSFMSDSERSELCHTAPDSIGN